MTDKIKLTHNKVSKFLFCRQAYNYYYNERLVPKGKSTALQVGDIIHQMMHLRYKGELTTDFLANIFDYIQSLYPLNDAEQTYTVTNQALTLMQGYMERWGVDNWNIVSSEMWMEVDCGLFILRGKADGFIRAEDNKLWRHEYKTAGKMDSAYLGGLKGGLQGAIYDFLAESTLNEKIAGTLYDLLVKTKVPQYVRAYAGINRAAIDRMHKTVEGVHRDIVNHDYYPSSQCFIYNGVCEYKVLCDFDSLESRQSFFTTYDPDTKEVEETQNKEDAA